MEIYNVVELIFLFIFLVFLGGIFLTAFDGMFGIPILSEFTWIKTIFEDAMNLFFSWFGILIAVVAILVVLVLVVTLFRG